jgi:RHH-type transcriptional regulator, proline utilization regulon repressor / proline dehydrogenase / delta 1-pyrroline-5-carboxylate dehydrogenase
MNSSFSAFSTQEIDNLNTNVTKLAEEIQNEANKEIRWDEKIRAEEFARIVHDPHGRAVFMAITDQVFRLSKDSAILKKFIQIISQHGIPSFFGSLDQLALGTLKYLGPLIPKFLSPPVVWSILKVMRHKTEDVILSSEQEKLNRYFDNCKKENIKVNINHLGDMVLGRNEEKKQLNYYLKELQNPNVSCISVKISTLYSQVDNTAPDHTVSEVLERLNKIIHVAKNEEQKTGIYKLVYLDMEEYKDLSLTVDVFKQFLQTSNLKHFPLGIALQAYIPDSFAYQQELTNLAKHRLSQGGAPIRIRIVKGANMEMEKHIASRNGWEQAPYSKKIDTDANFKRMVAYAFQPENLKAVKIGIGSHNIFEIAFSKTLHSMRGLDPSDFDFEMLEGIANHTRRSVQKLLGSVLTYSPVTSKEEFLNAIAYLVRRLMENTDKENFLSHSFNLMVGSPAWNEEEKKFLNALSHASNQEPPCPRHKQDRTNTKHLSPEKTTDIENFIPDSPTNFSLPKNQKWLKEEILKEISHESIIPELIPIKFSEASTKEKRRLFSCKDPSHNDRVIAQFPIANPEDLANAIRISSESEIDQWDRDEDFRLSILEKVAVEIQKNRASLIISAMRNVAKGVVESDAEVCEAIDFVRYYSSALKSFRDQYPDIILKKKGVVLVISPWNFPIAIPAGGIAAALATGNRVIVKPSPYSLLATWKVVELFWKAGVPTSALQFVPCEDKDARLLTENPKIDHVIFTGSANTADKILTARPSLDFSGETSGKNIFIITDTADKELAIKHLVDSTFGYNGQKCSATSIVILTKEVFSNPKFKSQLKDAVKSIHVGRVEPTNENKITPLITTPKSELLKALTELEPQEEWLVKPEKHKLENLWGPGAKWNVQSRSFTHLNEFFGPVLGVMKADDLADACRLANQTEYGLTAGLHSLDEEEINYFLETIQAGNLYVNNVTTGAIVGRQPFGGLKNSRRGAGGKAGGPNYILQLVKLEEKEGTVENKYLLASPSSTINPLINLWEKIDWYTESHFSELKNEIQRTVQGAKSCCYQYLKYFSKEHSQSKAQQVIGQENIFRYRKAGRYLIRVCPDDLTSDILLRLCAGLIAGNEVSISMPEKMREDKSTHFLKSHFLQPIQNKFSLDFESDDELCTKILTDQVDRIAYTHSKNIPNSIYKTAVQVNLPIFSNRPLTEGRFLLLEQFNEQCITYTHHRYGNLGFKQFEKDTSRKA